MAPRIEKLQAEIQKLPVDEQVELHEPLISSIYEAEPNLSPEWRAEIEKRAEEMTAGKVKAVSGEAIYIKLRKKYA